MTKLIKQKQFEIAVERDVPAKGEHPSAQHCHQGTYLYGQSRQARGNVFTSCDTLSCINSCYHIERETHLNVPIIDTISRDIPTRHTFIWIATELI